MATIPPPPPRLNDFAALLLLALSRMPQTTDGGAPVVRMRRHLEALKGRFVSVGIIYTTLEKLESDGLVETDYAPGGPERSGKPRVCARITPAGWARIQTADRQDEEEENGEGR